MNMPILHSLVEELLGSERLQAYVEALPERARISEPALPLVLAALHEARGDATVVLVPDDGDARDLAEAAGWLLGSGTSRCSRVAVSVGSPVWSRHRTSSVSVHARSTSPPPAGSSSPLRPRSPTGCRRSARGRRRSRSAPGRRSVSSCSPRISRWRATSGSTGSTTAASSPSAAVSSTCSRPRAASRSGSSSSATRSRPCGRLPVHAARVAPGRGSLRLSSRRAAARPRRDGAPARRGRPRGRRGSRRSRPAARPAPRLPVGAGRGARVWEEMAGGIELAGVSSSIRSRAASRTRSRRSGPRSPPGG